MPCCKDVATAVAEQGAPTRNLDLLRAVAVLLVACDHLFQNGLSQGTFPPRYLLAMGRLGVMVFFVHTSLVLMLSMDRMTIGRSQLFRSFYIRRLFRIYPLSIFTVVSVLVFSIPHLPLETFHRILPFELFSNFALIQNLTRTGDVIGPLWSLPWEVQMYLALPFIFVAIRSEKVTAVMIATALVVTADAVGVGSGHRAFRVLDYMPCFMGGVLAYILLRKTRLRVPGSLWPAALVLLIIIYGISGIGWPIRKVYYPEWSLCAVLGFIIPYFGDLTNPLLIWPAHQIAKYSYGIYLFHVPLIWLAFNRLAGIGPIASCILFVTGTSVLAVFGYHFIEAPMIRLGKRLAIDLDFTRETPPFRASAQEV